MNSSSAIIESLITPELRARVESIDTLPTLPEVYNRLVSELSSPDVIMKRIASIVSNDAAISAKLLQMANSAFFATNNRVKTVMDAVSFLGIDTVKGLVLSASVYSGSGFSDIPGFTPADLYRVSAAVGPKARFIAYCMGLQKNDVDCALTAGLLHDVGKLVLHAGFQDEFKAAWELSNKENIPLHKAQIQFIGANDAVLGGLLLEIWGLEPAISRAVTLHYEPSSAPNPVLDLTTAVHLAYASENNQRFQKLDPPHSAFDLAYTDALGISNQLSQFEDLSAEAVADNDMTIRI